MNVLDNSKKIIAQQKLHTALKKHLNHVANNKPSLDAFSKIDNSMVEKPFLDMENLSLDMASNQIENMLAKNNVIAQQIQNLKPEVLQSHNVAQVVAMKYENNNGKVSGEIKTVKANTEDGKNIQVEEEVVSLPQNNKIIKSFTINLDKNEGEWKKNTPLPLTKRMEHQKTEINDTGDEIYGGVVSVDSNSYDDELIMEEDDSIMSEEPEYMPEQRSEIQRAVGEMMGNMRTNKVMILAFLLAIIVVVFFLRQ